MLGRVIAPALLAGAMLACSRGTGGGAGAAPQSAARPGGGDTAVIARSIDDVLAAHTDSLMKVPGVVATAIGLCGGERCIKVLVARAGTAATQIPNRLEGYRVVVEVAGPITPR